ncbi:MAG: GIY-YIG nuclease family protein [Bacteroidales bacterium]|nr:GIY-YIG nuclease family protein [Bacteroidales bacterium]
MAYYVYVLKSLKDGNYYIGSTSDVTARLNYHNAARQRSTKNRIPLILIYSESCSDKKSALLREKQIKAYKCGNAFIKLINGV